MRSGMMPSEHEYLCYFPPVVAAQRQARTRELLLLEERAK